VGGANKSEGSKFERSGQQLRGKSPW